MHFSIPKIIAIIISILMLFKVLSNVFSFSYISFSFNGLFNIIEVLGSFIILDISFNTFISFIS